MLRGKPTGTGFAFAPSRLTPLFRALISLALVALCQATTLRAQTWNGGGGDNFWSTGGNWSGGLAPVNNGTAALAFAGSTRLTPDMNANWNILSLAFNSGAGAFTLGSTGSFTLTIQGGGITNNSASTETMNNAITLGAAQTWSAASGNLVFGGNVANGGFLLTIGGNSNTSSSGIISGTGGLTKSGAGTLTLSGANSYSGGTTINAGTLVVNSASSMGAITGGLTIDAGTLEVFTGFTTTRTITLSNAASTFKIDASQTFTDTSAIGGTGSLNKTGAGTMVLGGANTYTGATAISAGVLNIQTATGLGTTAGGTTVSSGAALQIQNNIAVGNEVLTLNGSGIASDGALRNISGANSMSGAITLGSAATIGSDAGTLTLSGAFNNGGFLLTETGTGNLTLSGVVSGAGGLAMNGTGTLTLSGAGNNTFTGSTTVSSGILALNKTAAIDALAGSLTVGDNSSPTGTATVRWLASNQLPDATAVTVNVSGILNLNTFSDKLGAITLYSGTTAGASITTGAGLLTLGGDITLNVSGTGATGATISGNLKDGGANRTITVNDGTAYADLTISAVMQGTQNYIKEGTGRLVLSGVNTNSGVFTINAGEVQLQNVDAMGGSAIVNSGGALALTGSRSYTAFNLTLNGTGVGGTGALLNVSGNNTLASAITLGSAAEIDSPSGALTLSGTITNGGFLLTIGGAGNVTTSGIISGTGGLTKTGSGTLTLSGTVNNTYTGVTTVNNGILQLNMTATKNAFNGALTVGDGIGAADSAIARWLNNNEMPAKAVTINSDGWLDLNNFSDAITTLDMTGGSLTTGSGTLTLGGTVTGNASSSSATISGNLGLGGNRTFTIADGAAATDMSISAIVSGAFTLTKDGAGTMALSGVNTYTGGTTINAGTLVVNSASSLGATSGGLTINAGTLEISTGYSTTRAITLGAATSTFQVDASQTFTDSIAIIGTGSLNKTGAGTMVLGGANTYAGSTNVSAGTLQISANERIANTSNLNVSGGTFDVQTFSETLGVVTLSSGTISGSGAGTLTGSSYTLQSGTVSAILAGPGTVTKNTSGSVTLSGANTFTGSTTISAGTLQVNTNNALGSAASGTTVANGAALKLNGVNYSTAEGLTLNGSGISNGGALTNSGTSTFAGAINIATNATISSGGFGTLNLTGGIAKNGTTLTFAGGGTVNITTNGITGSSSNSDLVIDGTTVVLSAANSYNGPTTVQNSGTLKLGNNNVLPTSPQTPLTVNTSSAFDLASYSDGVASLSGDSSAIVKNSSTGTTSTLTVNPGSGVSTTFAGVIAGTNGGTQGNVTLQKTGAGTLTLTGANTYSGATTISGGTLTAASTSGSALGSTNSIVVNSGGTLLLAGANDQINNAATMTLDGGTFNKGNVSEGTAGSVGVGALTLSASGSHIDFGTGTVGVLTFASFTPGAFTLLIDNWTGTVAQQGSGSTDRLIFDATQSGNLNSFSFTGYAPGAIEFDLGSGFYEVVPAAVPEPATYITGALALAAIGFHQARRLRRRSKRA